MMHAKRVFGHTLPAGLVAAVLRKTHAPLLNEGWFVAGVVVGGMMAVATFVLYGAPFFPDMPHSNPAAVRAVLVASLLVGLAAGLAGLAGRRQLRGPSPDVHRAAMWQRLMAAALLFLLGASGLWHAWLFSPWTRVLGVAAFGAALGLGFLLLPATLAFSSGYTRRLARAGRVLDRVFLLGVGLLGALTALPPIARAEPGAFFLALTQLLGLLTLPWVATMLAEARIHGRPEVIDE